MNLKSRFLILSLIFCAVSFNLPEFGPAASAQSSNDSFLKREQAYRANNVGVARLEQFNYREAAEDFRRALALYPDLKIAQINLAIALFNAQEIEAALEAAKTASQNSPDSPQPVYILGLIARNQNRTEDAEDYFRRVLKTDALDVGANVNLGQIYIQQRKYAEAVTFLRRAFEAEPYNATAAYNLATALLRSGAREEGQQLLSRFQALRESGAATNIGLNYLEQGRYAEAVTSTGAESELVDKRAPKVVFQNANVGLINSRLPARVERDYLNSLFPSSTYEILQSLSMGAVLFDFDNDGDLDLAKINSSITNIKHIFFMKETADVNSSISLFRNEKGRFINASRTSGELSKLAKNIPTAIVAGDFDNDGLADLFVINLGKLQLFRNLGKGRFADVSASAKLPAYPYLSISTAFADTDHDGDLDIFVAGMAEAHGLSNVSDTSAPQAGFLRAPNLLLRNNGDGTFTDVSETANVSQSKELKTKFIGNAVAVVPTDFDNRRDVDLLVLNHAGKPNLFRNMRDGSFRDIAGEVGLTRAEKWTCAAVGDFNKDGFVDFFFGRADGAGIFAASDGRGRFALQDAPKGTENTASAQFLDFDNDGLLDLLVNTEKGFAVARNLGGEWTNAENSVFKNKTAAGSRQILSGDVDGDGDIDLFAFAKNGALQFLRNDGGSGNSSEIIRLQGRVSNRTGIGAKVDLRAGSLSQKLEAYSASPAPAPAQIHFGLGKREKPDAVRVVWSSGVVQAEIEFPGEPKTAKNFQILKIEELDRKPSSCPYLFTWNGERFEFVTDFLGGGEMGNWKEAGVYHYPDSDEFVRITSDQLKPKNGKYELRVTNELEEVLFLDYLKLVAVEHDADGEVYPNEGLGVLTAGRRILYTTRNERAPLSAVNSSGKSVLEKIERLDRAFYDDFVSEKIRGFAETHHLTLNLDNKKDFKGRTLLLLTGWTDYAFSSDNLAASQSGKSLFLPKLQVKNKQGEWQTVIESIGISVGRPQTLVVDLTGKFLTGSREVRIVTNFKTFWDKIAVDTSEATDVKTVELKPEKADLGERGFSEEIRYGEMLAANYERVLNDSRWKYFSGSFTRTGAVNPLLAEIDDVFVISKTGDELTLNFDALPEPPKGKKYTFLLFADGYSKEMDINSGSPDAVLPLPFKGMKKYPYAGDERFPMSDEKRRLYDEYTTRAVKGFLPRLEAYLIK